MKQLTTNLVLALSLGVLGACASAVTEPQATENQSSEEAAKKEEEKKNAEERREWRMNFPHGRSSTL